MAAMPGTAAFRHACLRQSSPSQGACLHRLKWLSMQAVSGGAFQQRACWASTVRPLARRWDALVTQADKEQATTTETEEEELPVWARREVVRQLEKEDGVDLPFGVYLLASALVAIAAVGSVFEFANKNAIFGAVPPSSPLYAPILLTFAVTGIPSAGYLFFKAINSANREAERQDRADGF